MLFSQPRILPRTGLRVGRLGIGAGYGAPASMYEEALRALDMGPMDPSELMRARKVGDYVGANKNDVFLILIGYLFFVKRVVKSENTRYKRQVEPLILL